jgi:hypothetical protein
MCGTLRERAGLADTMRYATVNGHVVCWDEIQ